LTALLFFKEKIMVLFILLVYLILYAVYLPYKLKGLVDERA
jgi:ABC transporter, permease protein